MTIRDTANNPLVTPFTGQTYTVSAISDSGMYRAQFPITTAAAATGGRGGTIYRINTLADNVNAPVAVGDGSFRCSFRRAAQIETGTRIIVFEISGYINNNGSPIGIGSGNLTIAGQTAPSPGICLQNEGLQVLNSNVVIQHLASRPGNFGGIPVPQTSRNDAILLYSAFNPCFNVILDHCSVSWAAGKNLNFDSLPYADSLVWRCLDSEALYRASNVIVDPGQPTSLGMLINTSSTQVVDVIQSVFAHNSDRNPEAHNGARFSWINNIVYNWGRDDTAYPWASFFYTPETPAAAVLANFVENKYTSGPSANPTFFPLYAIYPYSVWPGTQIYILNTTLDQTVFPITGYGFNPAIGFDPQVFSPAIPLPTGYTPLSSSSMQTALFANVGSRPLDRSSIDTRVLNNITNHTGSVISSQADVGGYPTMAVNNRALTLPSTPLAVSPLRGSPFNMMDDYLESFAKALEP